MSPRQRSEPKPQVVPLDGMPPWALTSGTVDRRAGGKAKAVWDSSRPETLICSVQNEGSERDCTVTVKIEGGESAVTESVPPGYGIAIQRDKVKRITLGCSEGSELSKCRFRYDVRPAYRRVP